MNNANFLLIHINESTSYFKNNECDFCTVAYVVCSFCKEWQLSYVAYYSILMVIPKFAIYENCHSIKKHL